MRLGNIFQTGVRPLGWLLDVLGLEGRLFLVGSRRSGVLRRTALHAGDADVRAELAAMVQHRPALGLRHRRPRPNPSAGRGSSLGQATEAFTATASLKLG